MTATTFKVLPEPVGDKHPSRLIPKACFTSDDTEETASPFFDAADGSVGSGVWECAPCRMDIEAYPVNEMMTIIAGALTITNADGVAESFGPGEVVFVAKGSKMNWHITERLKKIYMTST